MKKTFTLLLIMSLLLLCIGCGRQAEKRSVREIIEEMVVDYGSYGDEANEHICALLKELGTVDKNAAARWESIMALWKSSNEALTVNYDAPADGLPDTDELCFVVLGFQLAPDGSMRDELIQRLSVALRCAERYPNALIVCTGGGTASEDPTATEAGRMAAWLIENGITAERVIAEDKSLTTAQNAIYTFDILESRYPRVKELVIVSSDYHIATGNLLFGAEAILRAEKAGAETVKVVSNAAWKAPSGTLSTMFQAGALIELSGDTDTAFAIYYDTYDIHELPPLK
ncbi:MAG: YdcF family protein [Oscillospiraceae bacterium]|nr:YdcF family protein [Oscillospiraceae bacterium]